MTGYSSDPARTRAIAHRRFDQLGIDSPPDIGPGLAHLIPSLPDPELLTTLLTPIADLLGVTLIRETRPQRSGSYNYTCAYIMEYIELHYDEDLSAGLLAEAAHCSVSYINHMFKKNVGVSLSRFIAEVRIRRAKKLLDDRRASIKSVAVSVGYSDTNYFSAVFRRITGLTPSEWRRGRRR